MRVRSLTQLWWCKLLEGCSRLRWYGVGGWREWREGAGRGRRKEEGRGRGRCVGSVVRSACDVVWCGEKWWQLRRPAQQGGNRQGWSHRPRVTPCHAFFDIHNFTVLGRQGSHGFGLCRRRPKPLETPRSPKNPGPQSLREPLFQGRHVQIAASWTVALLTPQSCDDTVSLAEPPPRLEFDMKNQHISLCLGCAALIVAVVLNVDDLQKFFPHHCWALRPWWIGLGAIHSCITKSIQLMPGPSSHQLLQRHEHVWVGSCPLWSTVAGTSKLSPPLSFRHPTLPRTRSVQGHQLKTGGDKVDPVVANSQTDVKSFFTQGGGQRANCPGVRHAALMTYAIRRKYDILHTAYGVKRRNTTKSVPKYLAGDVGFAPVCPRIPPGRYLGRLDANQKL